MPSRVLFLASQTKEVKYLLQDSLLNIKYISDAFCPQSLNLAHLLKKIPQLHSTTYLFINRAVSLVSAQKEAGFLLFPIPSPAERRF
jgi:hypothetical protein